MFTNIPYEPTQVLESQKRSQTVVLSSFNSGVLKISGFAAVQFIEGIALLLVNDKVVLSNNESKLLIKLFKASQTPEISLTRAELIFLKNALELRMAHCEKERDERNEKFNADTYIGQKLLLLDIREILLGEIVQEFPGKTPKEM